MTLLCTDPAVAEEVWCGCSALKYTGTRKPENVCACWELCNKLKPWECLVHVQSVLEHHQHKEGINLSSKYVVATGLNPFFGVIFSFPPCSLYQISVVEHMDLSVVLRLRTILIRQGLVLWLIFRDGRRSVSAQHNVRGALSLFTFSLLKLPAHLDPGLWLQVSKGTS